MLGKKMGGQALESLLVPDSLCFLWKSGFTEWVLGPMLLPFSAKNKAQRQNTMKGLHIQKHFQGPPQEDPRES